MRIIIAGSREMTDYEKLKNEWAAYKKRHGLPKAITIITGGAAGADKLAERLAREEGHGLIVMQADWQTHGKKAGPMRNAAMAKEAGPEGRLLAYWDGESPGTANMIGQAKHHGLKVEIVTLDADEEAWEQCRL